MTVAGRTTRELRSIQSKLLEMLEYFHAFCLEHEIQYYAIGGTLLGAVRHGGFIPWDDDVDLGVPRRDYDRLIRLADTVRPPFRMENFETGKDRRWPRIRLHDTSTTLVKDLATPLEHGVCIDVFPLDGTFDSGLGTGSHVALIASLIRLLSCKNGHYLVRDRGVMGTAILGCVLACMPLVPRGVLISALDHLLTLKPFETSRRVGNLVGRYGTKEIVDGVVFDGHTKLRFEHMEVFGPADPDTYLSTVYGDYMTLPPEEKRVSDHVFRVLKL